ncbi:accessory Sec system glycosyltransferase GtfA [Lactococcus lactis]|uniref:UDP-N-acetylglucosamine--peptide N-acetylglucosaminyltransferase GtfA subunit n=1 Tax=Lactococcus lactis TaxID=1358 RepID=A0AAP3Z320_9LACT|nr:accessory Sec system glycosyltransferase GtfA [Lactococcus lactis]MDG4977427.1 accessory Sec system glycosyltransferase GtfA [Lactococcus lactis]
MTIYNFNKGLGWASSGVEYAQAYRADILRKNNQKTKFVFTDMFFENIQPMAQNIGFKDDEIIWLYQYFTDIKISSTTYSLEKLVKGFEKEPSRVEEGDGYISYFFEDTQVILNAFIDSDKEMNYIYKTETIVRGNLIQRDYFSYVKIFSEYFKPRDNEAYLYQRRFFNVDGSIAYEELLNGKQSLFLFADRTIYSVENLVKYFVKQLNLTSKDILILDRATDIGPAILEAKGSAKIGVVIHADHFSEYLTNEQYILWNNFYDYQFKNADVIDFFICPTQKQKQIIEEQFLHYKKGEIKVFVIPVGSINQIKYSDQRDDFALITASRLAEEKHVDWLIRAVAEARKSISHLTLDIYGEGGERGNLEQLILEMDAQNYVTLKGQKNLTEVYQEYKTYISASTSEGFGLTLLEAVSSGLAMIGFNVRYGNQTFIDQGKNGYLIDYNKNNITLNVQALSQAIIKLYQLSQEERSNFEKTSYKIAQPFLTKNIQKLWLSLEAEITND